jgi:Fe-Mn family superoxide dismutase
MPFSLPPLPYSQNALANRGMGQETLELHHGKHHQAYVTALNGLIEGKGLSGKSLEQIVAEAGKQGADGLPVLNQAGQHWNHILFWKVMKRGGGGAPGGELARRIDDAFGNLEAFKDQFKTAAATQFGSGWGWLALDGDTLKVVKTANGSNPLVDGMTPLLGIDVWEHSYYLDYENRRPEYIAAFLNHLVNWEAVEANLQQAL